MRRSRFFFDAGWGIDDDADLSKVAWGHLAFSHFQADAVLAFYAALLCLFLDWLIHLAATQDAIWSAQWAARGTALALFLMLNAAAIANLWFYFAKPVGL